VDVQTAEESGDLMSFAGRWERTLGTTVMGALAMLAVVSCGAPVDDVSAPTDDAGFDSSDFEADGADDTSGGSRDDGGSTNGAEPDESDPAEEAPDVNEEEVGALGAPIDIPAEIEDQGEPLAQMRAFIEQGIRDQCGGELCVQLEVEHSDESFDECQFVETRPQQRSSVARGSTVVIVAGTLPCPPERQEGDESGSEGPAPAQDDGTESGEEPEPEQQVGEEATADDDS
jgi:hypothetical protein